MRLLASYHDGFIEFFYPEVFTCRFESPSCAGGLGDWLYDEFRLSPNGQLIHEVEWRGFPGCNLSLDSRIGFHYSLGPLLS